MTQTPLTGRCLCGRSRWRADTAPLRSDHCHCDSCRRFSGSGFTSFACFPQDALHWTGDPPARYTSPKGATRCFCATCGSSLSWASPDCPGEIHIHAGSYADPETFRAESQSFPEERVSWSAIPDDLPES